MRVARLEHAVARLPDPNHLTLLVFSGELDRLMAAFTVASGAAASGMEVDMFFTFWGSAALKRGGPQARGKTLVERMFGWLLPGGVARLPLSRLDFAGVGRVLMAREMKRKGIADLRGLIDGAIESGVRVHVCEMTLDMMGIRREELLDYPGLSVCGVASFIEMAASGNHTLFI
ncbi:MAG: DsrE/DsrF/DrsH-like family protein [Gammaproteobacteria bacterium]|nr:DsrE/DsrF/DrsH-like family protein [Gammaproteobacteria bacterium]